MADYFVDFSAAYNGTGTYASPWQYLHHITAGAVGAGDVVWVRRVTHTNNAAATLSLDLANILRGATLCGWPISGDLLYAVRPTIAQTLWDADAQQYAWVNSTDSAPATAAHRPVFKMDTAYNFTIHRMQFTQNLPATSNTGYVRSVFWFNSSAQVATFYNCVIEILGTLAAAASYYNAVSIGVVTSNVIAYNTTFTSKSAYTGYFTAPVGILADSTSTTWAAITAYNCTFNIQSNAGEPISALIGSSWGGSSAQCVVWATFTLVDCTINGDTAPTTQFAMDYRASAFGRRYYYAGAMNVRRSVMIRCKFNIPQSTSLNGSAYSFGHCVHVEDCEFTNPLLSIMGSGPITGNVRKLTKSQAQTTFALIQSGWDAPLYLSNVTVPTGNTADIQMFTGSAKYTINSITQGGGVYNVYDRNRLILNDIDGVVGSSKEITETGSITRSLVSRTGGSTSSYLMQCSSSAFSKFGVQALEFGKPGDENIIVGVAAGARTIQVFGAYKGTAPDLSSLYLTASYPTASARMRVTTRSTGALPSDTSVWSDGTLTPFVLTITLTAAQALPVAMYVSLTNLSSIVYIDPTPVVS